MFIRAVDQALEKLVRARLPLPEELGDVAFDPPDGTWSAQLSRITVSFFLYGVTGSSQVVRSPITRDTNGRAEKRTPQPMVNLNYLVSCWTGIPQEEHQLLGDLVSIVVATPTLPEEFSSPELASSVSLAFDVDPDNKPRELWSALQGKLKGCFLLRASVAADSFDWTQQAPPVEKVEGIAKPVPRQEPPNRFAPVG